MSTDALQSSSRALQNKKVALNRYQKYRTEPNVEISNNNCSHSYKKENRSHSFIFNLKVKNAETAPTIHKKNKKLFKKYLYAQNKTQTKDQECSTPYQQRKLAQKRENVEILRKRQKNSANKLQTMQGQPIRISELMGHQRKSDENLDKSNIRQTQSSAKERDDNYLTFTQQNQIKTVSAKFCSSLNLKQQKRRSYHNEKTKLKNIKVSFKQLVRAQKCSAFQKSIKKCLESDILKSINVTSHQIQRQGLKNSNKQLFTEQQQTKNSKMTKCNSKIKSHIRHNKTSSGHMQNFISSVMTIKPSNLEQKSGNLNSKQTDSSLSYKNSLIKVTRMEVPPSKLSSFKPRSSSKSSHQKQRQLVRKQKTQIFKSQPKEYGGWQYPNDFSQRQCFF